MRWPFQLASRASRRVGKSKQPAPAPSVISVCCIRRKRRPHRCSIGNFGRGQKRRRGFHERAGPAKRVTLLWSFSWRRAAPLPGSLNSANGDKQEHLLAAPGFHRGVPTHHRQGSLSCQCRQPSVQGRELGWKGRLAVEIRTAGAACEHILI